MKHFHQRIVAVLHRVGTDNQSYKWKIFQVKVLLIDCMISNVNHRWLNWEEGVAVIPAQNLLPSALNDLPCISRRNWAEIHILLPFYLILDQRVARYNCANYQV